MPLATPEDALSRLLLPRRTVPVVASTPQACCSRTSELVSTAGDPRASCVNPPGLRDNRRTASLSEPARQVKAASQRGRLQGPAAQHAAECSHRPGTACVI